MEDVCETVERPGYFGKHREARHREFDERFGPGNWRIAWQLGERVGPAAEAVMFYEDAYLAYLVAHPEHVATLARDASDVYDDAPSNVASGLDYTVQETASTHLQDVAIRRCMVRLGRRFQGSELIQIRDSRGDHPLSLLLSPGHVLFNRPDLIIRPELEGWWEPGSVESFYQSNKLLQVRQSAA